MRSQITVDIFAGPGVSIDAAAALELADRHGLRSLVARLLPYTVAGSTFLPDIHHQLRLALDSLRSGRVEDAAHQLHEACLCEPQSWQAVYRPGRATNPAAPSPAPGGLVNVHTYPPSSATTLAASYVFQARDHATLGGGPYFLGGGNGIARSTWRQWLRGAASVAVIAISSPRHVDDQRWRTIAAQTAAAVHAGAPWAAVRRTQPAGVLVFILTNRHITAATRRHLAVVATTNLRPAPAVGPPSPHRATPAATRPPTIAARRPPAPRGTP